MRSYRPPTTPRLPNPVSTDLYSRLSAADIARVRKLFDEEDRQLWDSLRAEEDGRHQIFLQLAAHYGDNAVMDKTGLKTAMPPEDVHSTARGKLAAGGSTYYADMVFGVLETAGIAIPKSASGLDFGSSSGRVTRVMQAYRDDIAWHGCDVNEAAIEWANQYLDPISFIVSPLRPPLPYEARTFDLVFAISIWSHFNVDLGRAWLDEVHRITKPGGVLFLTVHGLQSVFVYKQRNWREDVHINAILEGLYAHGYHFLDRFGKKGDWGVVDSEWGELFVSMAWIDGLLNPKWELLYYGSGMVEGNQDGILLRAR